LHFELAVKLQAPERSTSPWVPLRQPMFRGLWIATLVSSIGTWMHDVGAGWLMTSLSPNPLMVALVQAATTLPIFLFVMPAGVLADIVDRRRFLMAAQLVIMLAAFGLSGLTLASLVTP
jgi:MFS family permease